MKKLIAVVLMLAVVGCKGPAGSKGDKGENGIQGARGPGQIEILTGAILSDSMTFTDSRIASAKLVTIYLINDGKYIELPYFLPGEGVNVYPIVNGSANTIQVINGQLAGASSCVVVLIL